MWHFLGSSLTLDKSDDLEFDRFQEHVTYKDFGKTL